MPAHRSRVSLTRPIACATVIFAGKFCGFSGPRSARPKEAPIPILALFLAAGQLGNLLQQTGWVARVVLLFLLIFSLISWAIIFQKYRQFAAVESQTLRFLQLFRASQKLPEPKAMAGAAPGSPLVQLYVSGYNELQAQTAAANPHPGRVRSLNAITVAMQNAAADEVHRLEKWMPWLATTGSVAPFIGLFGTVWGVMDAFAGLGTAGAASLRAVAPGISEALVTTAAGLFAAIPAVIAYNHFLHHIKGLATRMDNFTGEFSAQVEKHFAQAPLQG